MQKVWQKNLSSPWFELIRDEVKIIEGRPNKGDFKMMKVGDIIEFQNKNSSYRVTIVAKKVYPTFKKMIEEEGLNNVLPGVKNVDDGVNVYRQWYDEELEKQTGVVAVHVKRIK